MAGVCKKHGYPLNNFGGCLKCDDEEKKNIEEVLKKKDSLFKTGEEWQGCDQIF